MGGVRTDTMGRTSLLGLYSAGEVASTGVHGANRLASNSLLEGLVFGARAANAVLEDSDKLLSKIEKQPLENSPADYKLNQTIRGEVSQIMWGQVGIIRDAVRLEKAINKLNEIAKESVNLLTQNYLSVAQAITRAAYFRQESRGGHYREDFPKRSDYWQCHTIDQIKEGLSQKALS